MYNQAASYFSVHQKCMIISSCIWRKLLQQNTLVQNLFEMRSHMACATGLVVFVVSAVLVNIVNTSERTLGEVKLLLISTLWDKKIEQHYLHKLQIYL